MIKYTVFEKLITEFRILGCKNSELFKYRDKLIQDLAPFLSDLARPFREDNRNSTAQLYSVRSLYSSLPIVKITNVGYLSITKTESSKELSKYLITILKR